MNKTTKQLVGLGGIALALILLSVYLLQYLDHRETWEVILLLSD